MKIIQTVTRYFPEKCGGIQIHLNEVLQQIKEEGINIKVAAAHNQPTEDFYSYDGIDIYRYPAFPAPKSEPNYGASPHSGFNYFAHWLKQQQADIYHQHQWTSQCGLPHLRCAKELGMKTVVSVRLPEIFCQRQTLMLAGKQACDGQIDLTRCSHCCGVQGSLSYEVLEKLSQIPMPVSVMIEGLRRRVSSHVPLGSSVGDTFLSPFSVPSFVAARQYGLGEMAKYADTIIAMSQWVLEALLINGIPKEKLYLLKHGISDSFPRTKVVSTPQHNRPLKVVFLGRWTHSKGIHILVEAIKHLPLEVPIELTIHGIPQDQFYYQETVKRIANDPRFHLAQPLKNEEVAATLSNFDVLAVPSQWLETGPMVVLEAFASGLPVIGSNLGGIAEKVRHGVDGLLVTHDDSKAWAKAFTQLATNSELLHQLCQGIKPVRSIRMEALESIELYQSMMNPIPPSPDRCSPAIEKVFVQS